MDSYFRDKKEVVQPNLVGDFLLLQDIDYYYFRLEKPIMIEGILIKEVYIDPYYEKHNEEFLEAKKKKGIKLTFQELEERIITND
ncbi:32745_t:CDS:2 [Gigaspora margarita]|uniref:32745_t:CDS:1 n=1 Tax=Gigaspora margarita TaxID=4874 RepID=A0ABN7VXQ9_GIGMA|nr:32745_t:CDS:2 [Gigaspora margarita]